MKNFYSSKLKEKIKKIGKKIKAINFTLNKNKKHFHFFIKN